MKVSHLAGLCLGVLPQVLAQYEWTSLALAGVTPVDYLYVRPHAGGKNPVTDVTSLDLRCNVKGSTSSAKDTLSITNSLAGYPQQIVWRPNVPITVPGAWTIYLAQAPANHTAVTFDGSGKVWFKLAQGYYRIPTFELDPTVVPPEPTGPAIPQPTVGPVGVGSIKATLPAQLPSAEYLVRAEYIDLSKAAEKGGAKFYVACGQISYKSLGKGVPGPLVPIPGVYSASDPGILIGE
ncbi:hypothetical protein FRC02_006876 [Tulasnella sp. 418]|nr:hypothetical protein FRC02_006876 [Tulasnella sp. 418]